MSLQYFKPNKSGTGICCNFAVKEDDKCFYVNLQRQTGEKQFKGGKRLATKLNAVEAGQILTCIERNQDQQMVHKTDIATTNIFFQKLYKYDQEAKAYTKDQLGYYISVTRTSKSGEKETFKMGFNYGEAAVLREYLKWGLVEIFKFETEANRQEQVKRAKNKAEEPKQEVEPEKVESEESNESEPVQEETII